MNQQVNVNLTLTLEVDATLNKKHVEVFTNALILRAKNAKQISVISHKIDHIAEEAEIYGNDESLPALIPWRFVEKFYPDYDHCNEIAYNNDLSVILDDGPQEGSCAMSVFEDLSEDMERVVEEYNSSCAAIYEKAIQAFIESHPNLVRP